MTPKYDAIVIGSGIGGLTVASLLSQVGNKRVLVLESHFKLGGFTHAFQRKGYEWDVGLHYVGDMDASSLSRQVMDMVTGGAVKWAKMPDPIEHFVYPDHHLQVPSSEHEYKETLKRAFPKCTREIDQYFKLVKRARGWIKRWTISKTLPKWLGQLVLMPHRRLATQTVKQVLEETISDAQLRGILVSQRGNYGLPPAQCAFGMHAIIVNHYLTGGYVPVGGAGQIARAVVRIVEKHGGDCLVGHKVRKFEIENNRITKVIVERKGQLLEFEAPLIISAAGAEQTFQNFVPYDVDAAERKNLKPDIAPPTTVNVYVGMKDDPRTIGMDAGNYWIANDYDHDAISKDRILQDCIQFGYAFLSSSSLRDATAKKHVAQIVFMSDYDAWQHWESKPWLNRGQEYEALKQQIAEHAIELIDRQLPGFRKLVDYVEVSTPLSVVSCVGHRGGAIYGMPATPQRFQSSGFHSQSSVENLLLTGSDIGTFGIVGAMMSGVMTSAWALGGFGLPLVMRSVKKFARELARRREARARALSQPPQDQQLSSPLPNRKMRFEDSTWC